MTKPLYHLGDAFHPRPVGQFGPLQHDHGKSEFARHIDLGSRAFSAGVAGDDPFDSARAHHVQLALEREWSARHNDVRIGKRQRLGRRIDKSQRIGVLRFGAERRNVLPADRKENASARQRQRRHGGGEIGYLDPLVTGCFDPRRSLKRDQPRSGCCAGRNRVAAHFGREGMGRIDDMRDFFPTNVFDKAACAAKTAGPRRQRLDRRRARAPSKGVGRFKSCARNRLSKQASIARSAQYEGACHA
jgi:hypothetical protein